MREDRPYEQWMRLRAAAETHRLNLFQLVCGLRSGVAEPTPREGELPLLPLQLEYFRRFQLAVQMRFYKGRAEQHRKTARKQSIAMAGVAFAAALVVGLSSVPGLEPLLDGLGVGGNDLLAFFGLTLPVVYQSQESVKLMLGDRRNALRYDTTSENLRHIAQGLDAVRARVAEGDRDSFRRFAAQVNEQVSTEHREWLKLRGDVAGAGGPAVVL
jgi:hypothetical protein